MAGCGLGAGALGGCGGEKVWAPQERVDAARYVHPGPPRLTLLTMVNNKTGSGAHTALMINASQRVVFDPAGSLKHSLIPERNDVLFGMTPRIADFFIRAHARVTFHVVIQELDVSPQVAELAMRRAMEAGPVAGSMCTRATSALLAGLPGLESLKVTWFPNNLSAQFGALPGVRTEKLYEYDDDDKTVAYENFKG